MIKRTQIKKKHCKCSPDCKLYPTLGSRGFNFAHLPQLEKIEKVNKHRKSQALAAKRAVSRKKLHSVQFSVGLPKNARKEAKRQSPIPKFSKKRMADIKIYNVLRRDFLIDHPRCECGMPDCDKGKSVDVHHTFMGSDRNRHFTHVETWKAVSRKDHIKIHLLSTEQMIEYGLRKFD